MIRKHLNIFPIKVCPPNLKCKHHHYHLQIVSWIILLVFPQLSKCIRDHMFLLHQDAAEPHLWCVNTTYATPGWGSTRNGVLISCSFKLAKLFSHSSLLTFHLPLVLLLLWLLQHLFLQQLYIQIWWCHPMLCMLGTPSKISSDSPTEKVYASLTLIIRLAFIGN